MENTTLLAVFAHMKVVLLQMAPLKDFEVECPWHGSKFDVRTGEVMSPPASEPEPTYQVKVDGNSILIKKQGKNKSSQLELTLIETYKTEGIDVVSFKFGKEREDKSLLDFSAGQFAFFDIGEVYNDPKGPIRHFTISSSPTEDFIMFSTRIRNSPYKRRLSTLEQGAKVKVRGPEGQFVLHEDYLKPAVFLSGGIGVTQKFNILYLWSSWNAKRYANFASRRSRNSKR
ncbi:MAG: Rieske 2Fe-2S domain-containing protein [Nitrososphaeraceae archaeon]